MPILRNQRHEAFARSIVTGMSATAAYVAAGYSKIGADGNSSRLIGKDSISARISELKTEAAAGAVATAQQVLEELTKLALVNAADYYDENGDLKPISALTREQAAAIVEFEAIPTKGGGFHYWYKLADKKGALVELGRHYGLFRDKVELGLMQTWEQAVIAVAEARQKRLAEAKQQALEADPAVPRLTN